MKYLQNRTYNRTLHDNHKKPWKVSEIKTILEDNVHTLVELGMLLGRTPATIATKRSQLKHSKIK